MVRFWQKVSVRLVDGSLLTESSYGGGDKTDRQKEEGGGREKREGRRTTSCLVPPPARTLIPSYQGPTLRTLLNLKLTLYRSCIQNYSHTGD